MDRMEEYEALLREPEELPPALEGAVGRARARARRRRLWRRLSAPAGSAAAVLAVFVLMVNLWTPFALACAKVPILKQLTAAVAFSPSLKAAVEHDYVQYIGQSQTDGGVTMTVEYVIADARQVNIFFTIDSAQSLRLNSTCRFLQSDDTIPSMAWDSPWLSGDPGELYHTTAVFVGADVPEELTFVLEVWPEDSEPSERAPTATFSFDLHLDPGRLAPVKSVPVGRWLELDGQRIYVRALEIFPTHARLDVEDDPDNTAWLHGLDACLTDGSGRRYGPSGGLSASGSEDGTPFMASYHFESPYFSDPERLTLSITGADWVDKELQSVTVNLDTLESGPLPDGVTLQRVERDADNVILHYRAPVMQVFSTSFTAPDGESWSTTGVGYGAAGEFTEDGRWVELENQYDGYLFLGDYPWDTVTLELNWSRTTVFDTPATLTLK